MFVLVETRGIEPLTPALQSLGGLSVVLIVLRQAILDDPRTLAAEYERLWVEQLDDPRSFYDEVRAKFNATHEPHHLLYLLARCRQASGGRREA